MIHEIGIELSDKERKRLESNAFTQDRQIAMIMMKRAGKDFTTHEMTQVTGFNKDSVKRSMSHMAGCDSAPDKYEDDWGRYPLVKLDSKRLNPETGVHTHLYQWNKKYRTIPNPVEKKGEHIKSHKQIVQEHAGKQMNFHPEL